MKTTKAHFKLFRKYVKKYIKKWKLTGWNIYFYHIDLGKNIARYDADYREGAVSFSFTIKWFKYIPLTQKEIKKAAKHEVGHLLIDPLYSLALERFVSEEELSTADERLVNHIVKLLPEVK